MERKKWVHAFRNAQTIVFTFDVSCYDRTLLESDTGNRMVESFELWDSLVNANWSTKTNFVVMFTKKDRLTRAKLRISPITTIFHDMLGDSGDPDNALQHMIEKLKSLIKKRPDSDRSILFCSASIAQSQTDLAETTLDAIRHAAYQQQAFIKSTHGPISRFARFK